VEDAQGRAGRGSAYVKNRCKNGDFYWVEAHASPLREAGQVVGYMSVRKKASQSTIDATEQAYRMFRENRAGGKRIELGQVASGIGLGRKLGDMSLKAKLGGVMAILALLLLVVGIMGLSGMGQSNEGLRVVYEQRTMALADVTNINRLVTRNRGLVQDSLIDPVAGKVAANADAMQKNIAEITKIAEGYKARITDPEEKQRFERFATDRGQFVKEGLLATMELLKAGKLEDGRKVYTEKAAPLSAKVREHVDALRDLQLAGAKHEYEAALARYDLSRNLAIGLIVAGLLLALIASISLIRAITRPLDQAIEVFNKVGQGIYGNFIDTTRDDEIGKVLQSLESMQTKLGFDVAEAKRQADETLRIKIALDNVSTGVMIANGERTIIYANHAVKRVLKGAESEIKKQLPNFDAENMVGVSIDTFHKNPKHQADLLASFTSTYVANLEIGGRYLRVTASPVINERNERLGAVAEWLDRTPEVLVEKEVANIVDGAQRGDFVARISLEGKDGFFRQLSEGLNQLSEVTQTGLTDVARVLQLVAAGDLTQKIEADYQGIFGQLKDDTNTTIERLREVVGRIKDATEAINIASQEIAAGNQDLSSRTEEQASSLEETSSAMEELNATVKQNAENAKQANELAKTSNAGRDEGRPSGQARGGHHGRHPGQLEEDLGHHRRDRQHRLPDQHPGAERRGRSRAGGRTGTGLCGGRHRSEEPGAAERHGGEGNQDADRRIGGQGREWRQAGTAGGHHHGRSGDQLPAGGEPGDGDRQCQPGAELGDRTDHAGREPDGRSDAAERGAGGRSGGGGGESGRAGPGTGTDGEHVQAGGGRRQDAAGAGPAGCDAEAVGGEPATGETGPKKIAPPHLADDGEQWEEF
jgi:methyl-accepting chemotaxis protein